MQRNSTSLENHRGSRASRSHIVDPFDESLSVCPLTRYGKSKRVGSPSSSPGTGMKRAVSAFPIRTTASRHRPAVQRWIRRRHRQRAAPYPVRSRRRNNKIKVSADSGDSLVRAARIASSSSGKKTPQKPTCRTSEFWIADVNAAIADNVPASPKWTPVNFSIAAPIEQDASGCGASDQSQPVKVALVTAFALSITVSIRRPSVQ